MPLQERLQLAGAIVQQRGRRLADLPDLTPLLRFTQGNPLTILVTVGEVLRASISTPKRLEVFVESLQSGEATLENEASEGRSKSLRASLTYGFDHAFTVEERKILAVLHLFQGFVDVANLYTMWQPEMDWRPDVVHELTPERGLAILDRATEIGLLRAHGRGYYTIHPALPRHFRDLFEQSYSVESGAAERARRAFVQAICAGGTFYRQQYREGERNLLSVLAAQEANLLSAWRLAREYGWWHSITLAMQGLRTLYSDTSRFAAWLSLVEAVVPDFVDLKSDGPLPGREAWWELMTAYRVDLAKAERRWKEAERLRRLIIARYREKTCSTVKDTSKTDGERYNIRELAVSVEDLAHTQLKQNDPACALSFLEALGLYQSISAKQEEAVVTLALSGVYLRIAELRNFDEAERWCHRSLELFRTIDTLGRGQCFNMLGTIAYERFEEASVEGQSSTNLHRHLIEAAQFHEHALTTLPETATADRGMAHAQLGKLFTTAGDIDRALHHLREALRLAEKKGLSFEASVVRLRIASALCQTDQLADARLYALAALDTLQTLPGDAADEIQLARLLIAAIEVQERGAATDDGQLLR